MFKKAFTLVLCLTIISPGFAQVIIYENDIAGIGSKIYRDRDVTPDSSIGLGMAGASVIWDMKALMTDDHDSLYFADPRNTPYDLVYPGSNFCFIEPLLISYMNLSTIGITLDGRYSTSLGPVIWYPSSLVPVWI